MKTAEKPAAYPLRAIRTYQCRHEGRKAFAPDDLHTHNAYEVYIHIRGHQSFHIAHDVHVLRPMDAIVTAPGQVHGLVGGQQHGEHECLLLHLTEQQLDELSCRRFSLRNELERITRLPGQRLLLNMEQWRSISPLAAGVKDDLPDLLPVERQISFGCLSTILGILSFAAQPGHPTYVAQRNTTQAIRHIGSHIAQHFTEDCSLDALAEMFNMSKFHLARRFEAAYGASPHQYMLRCRISCAKRLLLQGEAPSSVSQACGFNDYSSFLRAFTKQTGMSPTAWRKAQRDSTLSPAGQPDN